MKSYNESMISLGDKNYIIDIEKYTEILANDTDELAVETETEETFQVNGEGISKLASTTVMTREYEKTQVIDGPK